MMPPLIGIAREHSGGFAGPTLLVAAVLIAAAALVAAIHYLYRREFSALLAPHLTGARPDPS